MILFVLIRASTWLFEYAAIMNGMISNGIFNNALAFDDVVVILNLFLPVAIIMIVKNYRYIAPTRSTSTGVDNAENCLFLWYAEPDLGIEVHIVVPGQPVTRIQQVIGKCHHFRE